MSPICILLQLSICFAYGCSTPGYYGANCSTPCPDPNCQYCHIETGKCQGCKQGYFGQRCETGQEDNQTKYLLIFLWVLVVVFIGVVGGVLPFVLLRGVEHLLCKRRPTNREGANVQTGPEEQVPTEGEEMSEVQTISEEIFSSVQYAPDGEGNGFSEEIFTEFDAIRERTSNDESTLNAHAAPEVQSGPGKEQTFEDDNAPERKEDELCEDVCNDLEARREKALNVNLNLNEHAAPEVQSGPKKEPSSDEHHVPGVDDGLYEEVSNDLEARREKTSDVKLTLNKHSALHVQSGSKDELSTDEHHVPGGEYGLYEEVSNDLEARKEKTSDVKLTLNKHSALHVQSSFKDEPCSDEHHAPGGEYGLYEEVSNEEVAGRQESSNVEQALNSQAIIVEPSLPEEEPCLYVQLAAGVKRLEREEFYKDTVTEVETAPELPPKKKRQNIYDVPTENVSKNKSNEQDSDILPLAQQNAFNRVIQNMPYCKENHQQDSNE